MSAFLAPTFGAGYQALSNTGSVLTGGLLYTYFAGSTSSQNTWTDSTQSVPNSNPIVLSSSGRTSGEIWLQGGSTYKFVLKDSVGNTLGTWDNVSGLNDANYAGFSEWITYGSAPTYISTTSFTVSGNQTALLTTGRRLQYFLLSGTYYGTISTSIYNSGPGNTTVNITPDSTNLNNTLYSFGYGFMSSVNTSLPLTTTSVVTPASLQVQAYTSAISTGGTNVYAATPSPSLLSLTANSRLRLSWNATSSGASTLNVSGLGAISVKQYNSAGSKINPTIVAGVLQDIEYDGTNWMILDPLAGTAAAFTSGSIDNVAIGATTATTGAFTSLSASSASFTTPLPAASGGSPTGSVTMYPVATPPTGWLLANGASVSTTTYATLFAIVGYTFGGSAGSFNLPDYRDRMPVGAGTTYTVAATGGAATTTIGTTNLPAHSHGVNDPGHLHPAASVVSDPGHFHNILSNTGGNYNVGGSQGPNVAGSYNVIGMYTDTNTTGVTVATTITSNTTGITTQNTGSGTAITTISPYIGIYFIIKS